MLKIALHQDFLRLCGQLYVFGDTTVSAETHLINSHSQFLHSFAVVIVDKL